MSNEDKKKDLAKRVLGPQKAELASRVQDNMNKSKKLELAAKIDSIAKGTFQSTENESCGCNVHFTVDPRLSTDNGKRTSLTAQENNPNYDWEALVAAGVNPLSLVSVESQLYQLVNNGTIRASAALDLLGFDQI